ncbi:MAG: AEC family transporter [Candidatus Omnitrophota bacterium]
MFLEHFRITGLAVAQISLLGLVGYILVKKNILGQDGLDILSRLVVDVTLPALILAQLIKDFRFDLYPNWWLFPLLSFAITLAGLLLGVLFMGLVKGPEHKLQFISLVGFQNSGYLPLALFAALLTGRELDTMLVYLFLFLLGFNLVILSFGVYILSFHKLKKFEARSLFSPPVIATITGLIIVFFGLYKFIPDVVIKPMRMIGDCTVPLSMLAVGGSLASICLRCTDKKIASLVILSKLIILPALGLWLVLKLQLPHLLGLLIIIELAVPSATLLSVITRHYKKEDLIISQGIFVGHVASLVTLPLFLSLYFMLSVVR